MVTIRGGILSRPVIMRAGPGSRYKIIAEIPQGSVGDKIGGRDGWTWLTWKGEMGWIPDRFAHDGDGMTDNDHEAWDEDAAMPSENCLGEGVKKWKG